MKRFVIALAGVATLGIGGFAVAQDQLRRGPDADGNGSVSRAEATAAAERRFERLDANNDGRLTREDRTQREREIADRRFAAMDADRDNSISRAEFDAHVAQRSERGRGWRAKRGGPLAEAVIRTDANNDGAIDKAEYARASAERFQRNDANNDGQVTREERRAGWRGRD